MRLTSTLKKSKLVHSAYKMLRDRRQVPPGRWRETDKVAAVFRALPNTMLPMVRLFDAYDAVLRVDAEGIEGDVVECGVWNGGCVGLMATAHGKTANAPARVFHLFDSFEGLPEPSGKDVDVLSVEHQGSGELVAIGACAGDKAPEVERFLTNTLGLSASLFRWHVGWFQDTVPGASDVDRIAILRLDGDWYDSTKVCLEGLFDRVVPGGYVIIDDYGCFAGCREAVDEFLFVRGLKPSITYSDEHCIYFRRD